MVDSKSHGQVNHLCIIVILKVGSMLYLTPEAPFQCGTTMYAHKKTRARTYHEPGWDESWRDVPGDPF